MFKNIDDALKNEQAIFHIVGRISYVNHTGI